LNCSPGERVFDGTLDGDEVGVDEGWLVVGIDEGCADEGIEEGWAVVGVDDEG